MAWLILVAASAVEIVMALALKYADGWTRFWPSVIGIAAGTVLLPEMSRRLAAGDEAGAAAAQQRTVELTVALAVPCVAAFLAIPELLMRGLFARGAFTSADALSAGRTLAAYATGLLPFVVLRAFVAPFHARRDTTTPMIAAFVGVGVNVALKIALMAPLAQVGLALGTAAGAWVNVALLYGLAARRGFPGIGGEAARRLVKLLAAGAVLGAALWASAGPLRAALAGIAHADLVALAILAVGAAVLYAALVLALLGRGGIAALLGRGASAPPSDPAAPR